MKIKLEKPVTLKGSLLKKETLSVEQKLEKKPRKKSNPLTEQESRLIEQDKKQEVAIRKQVRTPRRKTIDTPPSLPKVDTWPIDEKEQNNHEKDPLTAFAPENIPVEPENFDDITFEDIINKKERTAKKSDRAKLEILSKAGIPHLDENLDNSGLRELLGIKDEQMSYEEITESIKNLEETDIISKVEDSEEYQLENTSDEKTEEHYTYDDEDGTQIVQNPLRESMDVNRRNWRSGTTNREWKNFKNYLSDKNPDLLENMEHPKTRMATSPTDSVRERMLDRFDTFKKEQKRKGFINRIKDFFSGVKAEKEALVDQFDNWNEQAELEKQAKDYQASLKRTEDEARGLLPKKGSEFNSSAEWYNMDQDVMKRPYSANTNNKDEERPFKKAA